LEQKRKPKPYDAKLVHQAATELSERAS